MTLNPNIIFIKLGGSVITNKEKPNLLRRRILSRLVKEIKKSLEQAKDEYLFVIGHGQGSFGHIPAIKYKTLDGFINKKSKMGMAIVQDKAADLNRIVIKEFIKNNIPAISIPTSGNLVTNNRKAILFFGDVLKEYLNQGLLPVTYGDVIVDKSQGCTIWSTDEIFTFLALELQMSQTFKNISVIHVTESSGFLNSARETVPKITRREWEGMKRHLSKTKGYDVTGGMGTKIEQSLLLADAGIKSYIISGLIKENLYNILTNKHWIGTEIK